MCARRVTSGQAIKLPIAVAHCNPAPLASSSRPPAATSSASACRPSSSETLNAFKAAITKLIVTDKAFSDQNFKEKLREYFIKLQRQARSELEPRTTDPEWTEHCTMVDEALESPEWLVAETDTNGAGSIDRREIVDGAYMNGEFKFQDLLDVGKGVPEACK